MRSKFIPFYSSPSVFRKKNFQVECKNVMVIVIGVTENLITMQFNAPFTITQIKNTGQPDQRSKLVHFIKKKSRRDLHKLFVNGTK